LDHAYRTGRRVAVLFIDLDGFKHVNDTLGHTAGDRLLQEVARRLISCTRDTDTVARLSGDEFTVVLEGLQEPRHALPIASSVVESLGAGYTIDGHPIFVTASVGLSTYPDDGTEAAVLLQRADAAMYQAKEAGGNDYQPRPSLANASPSDHAVDRGLALRPLAPATARTEERL